MEKQVKPQRDQLVFGVLLLPFYLFPFLPLPQFFRRSWVQKLAVEHEPSTPS